MTIDLFKSDNQILWELGIRLKKTRIRSGQTQAQLAENSGVAKTTIERAEKGESIQFLNVVKIFRSLNMLGAFGVLLPSTDKTPLEYLKGESLPKRVHVKKTKPIVSFKWGDEK